MADSSVNGKSYIQLYQQYQQYIAEGKSKDNSKGAAKVWNAMTSLPEYEIIQNLQTRLVELDRQIDELTPYLSLTDEEKQAFMDKAIADIEPWYQEKVGQINQSVQEGKVRTAEDTLLMMREINQETDNLLAKYDLTTAETEEEFLDRISALTTNYGDDLQAKRLDWTQRLENVKLNQIQQGIFSSGIGKKERALQEQMKENEFGSLQNKYQQQQTELERNKKYDLEQVQLARQSAEQNRIRQIGAPADAEALANSARNTIGGDVGSYADVMAQRNERGITPMYSGQDVALRNLEEDKGTRVLSRAGEYQSDELAAREAEYGASIDKILAEQAKKQKQLQSYGVY